MFCATRALVTATDTSGPAVPAVDVFMICEPVSIRQKIFLVMACVILKLTLEGVLSRAFSTLHAVIIAASISICTDIELKLCSLKKVQLYTRSIGNRDKKNIA
jgi:hypothetical protein